MQWLPTPVFLPGESHGQRSLGGLWSIDLAMTERLTLSLLFFMILLLNISITYIKRSFFNLTRVKRYFLSVYTGDVQGGETESGELEGGGSESSYRPSPSLEAWLPGERDRVHLPLGLSPILTGMPIH